MKAPDKIFVRDFGNSLCKVWTYTKGNKKDDVDLVYVHKKAILEWAESRKTEASIGLSEYDAGHENGICEVLNELINHIESL